MISVWGCVKPCPLGIHFANTVTCSHGKHFANVAILSKKKRWQGSNKRLWKYYPLKKSCSISIHLSKRIVPFDELYISYIFQYFLKAPTIKFFAVYSSFLNLCDRWNASCRLGSIELLPGNRRAGLFFAVEVTMFSNVSPSKAIWFVRSVDTCAYFQTICF